jgi:hypothetical protein
MKPNKLYHCTTPKKAKLYRQTGYIISPVRGFDSLQGAMAWCIKTGRTVILELEGWTQEEIHKLPDHHNKFATAFWVDKNVKEWHCVFSSDNDA